MCGEAAGGGVLCGPSCHCVPLRGQITKLTGIAEDQARALAAFAVVAPGCSLTWAELWPIYWEAEGEKLESASRASEGRHIARILGPKLVTDTTVRIVRWYRATRKAEIIPAGRGKGGHPSPKTINNEVIAIRHVTRWAARQRPPMIPTDPLGSVLQEDLLVPVDNVRLNVVEDDPMAALSLAAFIEHGDEFDRAMCLTAHSSGMRRREIQMLDLSWIDRRLGPDGKPLRLVMIPPGISKGRRGRKKGRLTIISEEALAAVDEYRRTLPMLLQHRCTRVFVNPDTGDGFVPDTFTSRFKRLQQRAGATGPSGPVWLHDLRRSFITLARRRGEDAVNVMDLVGHSTLESQERYHVKSLREALAIRDRIEAARALELAGFANERRGPLRAAAPVDNYQRENFKRL